MKTSIALSVLSAALLAGGAYGADRGTSPQQLQIRYKLTVLDTLGGNATSGNSINDRGWIAGQASYEGEQITRAALWRGNGAPTDLGTLGGPNSAVLWPVKNVRGIITGIAQTDETDPLNERWSCFFFFPSATARGKRCMGFKWQNEVMTRLPPFPGGTHSFATGANNWGQVVGWAENAVQDSSCTSPQVLQFHAALWGPGKNQMHALLPLSGDRVSSATAINDRGQVVGISGACSNAVGGLSARHNVLWENGQPTNIGDFGGIAWNTPMMINQRGDVVGFANDSVDDGTGFDPRPFLWIKGRGIRRLDLLPNHAYGQALGINEWRQVVGQSCDAADVCRAVLWQNNVPTDLNQLLMPSAGVTLTSANDIDDLGRITGNARESVDKTVAFKATPFATTR